MIKDLIQRREYQRKWKSNRRSEWFSKNGPCIICGSFDRLELDHIDPSTKISHNIWSWFEKRRSEELSKCQVLCHECHLNKTKIFLSTSEHGTSGMYSKGCKCDICRTYQRLKMSEYRKKK